MKPENNWRNKSIQALEKKDWGEPNYDSYLVKRCFQLSKIPLEDFTIEDLRLMIGQNIALEYLIPLAIETLQTNILAEGDYYPGDLLKNVISVNTDFWVANQQMYTSLKELIQQHQHDIQEAGISVKDFI